MPQRTTFTWSVADLCSSGWNPTQYNTRLSESESPRSGTTHKQVRGALSLHNNTHSWGHLICSGSDPFLCTFLLSRKNANKPVQPLLQYALPHHLPRFAAQCEYLFAQTGLLSIHVSVVAEWSVHTRAHTRREMAVESGLGISGTVSHQLRAAGGIDELRVSYLSTWSRFPDTPSPPMV